MPVNPRPDGPSNLSGVSFAYIADLFIRYLIDPASVDESWRSWFAALRSEEAMALGAEGSARRPDKMALEALAAAFRHHGHLAARLDPLSLAEPQDMADLDPARYGLQAGSGRDDLAGHLGQLRTRYCGTVGFEFMHIDDAYRREWLRRRIEEDELVPDAARRIRAAERLVEADELELFMNRRFPAMKRFGAEGAETLIPVLDAVLARSAERGVREIIAGGTSRARLNVLVNAFGKPVEALFAEMQGRLPLPEGERVSADVPYHFGFAGERDFGDAAVTLRFANNPSHLEAVDTVVMGMARATQEASGDRDAAKARIAALLLHTDAAFAGQGVVAEALQLSGLAGYEVGGIVHVIVNNQIGFTTGPGEGRSSRYCSDVARAIGAPIFHVNGDDPDAAVRVALLAVDYRAQFHGDVVVDLVCYRRRGHNEIDEPSFTQPRMYRVVKDHPSVRSLYVQRLAEEGVVTGEWDERIARTYRNMLSRAWDRAPGWRPNLPSWPGAGVKNLAGCDVTIPARVETGVSPELLREVGDAISRRPKALTVNPKIDRFLGERRKSVMSGHRINWATAEALALGTLLCEGTPVRLSGQDTLRGAFTQRHLVLVDAETEAPRVPLNEIRSGQARLEGINSPLSEYGTLGFEYGYSLCARDELVIWEAQFGDFANLAQVIIDQFISSGADKWLQRSGLVLLLPHGLEGQGPEHSSARMERFLQLCAGGNMIVVTCSTPANYFHVLRGQGRAQCRVPLIVFTPKALLRHREAVSKLAEMGPDTRFEPVLRDNGARPGRTRRIVLCSGKVYYDLNKHRRDNRLSDVAILRLERLHPFPADALAEALAAYDAEEVIWCQEEPKNMGAWSYVDRRLETVLTDIGSRACRPRYVGRPANPSPAIGVFAAHDEGQTAVVQAALS